MPTDKDRSMKKVCACVIAVAIMAFAYRAAPHSGGIDKHGCHAGSQPYHCHGTNRRGGGIRSPLTYKPDAKRKHASKGSEDFYNDRFCGKVGGERDVRHAYRYPTGESFVSIDCETSDTVYEGGLDKRSSLDSVQQALFASRLTGKKPAVVIYDRDGEMGRYEYRIKAACEKAGVMFVRFRK